MRREASRMTCRHRGVARARSSENAAGIRPGRRRHRARGRAGRRHDLDQTPLAASHGVFSSETCEIPFWQSDGRSQAGRNWVRSTTTLHFIPILLNYKACGYPYP
eukprot:4359679-Prymnesium_polylepis.2